MCNKIHFFTKLFTIAFALFLLVFAQQNAFACSCRETPTVLEDFESSEIVITASIVSLVKKDIVKEANVSEEDAEETEEEPINDYYQYKSVKILIEKAYKGGFKAGEELFIKQGSGADCGFTFSEKHIGKKYLFYMDEYDYGYAGESDDKGRNILYSVSFCGRSTGINGAFDDLAYLDKLDKVRGKTRISGTVLGTEEINTKLVNIPVNIIGDKKVYKVKTDKNGFFEIYDLPAGKYYIEPKIPFGWKINKGELNSGYVDYQTRKVLESKTTISLLLGDKRHSDASLYFEIDNAISGRIISPTGKPMPNVSVRAFPSNDENFDSFGSYDYTNEKGEFTLTTLSVGNYILVINSDGKFTDKEPFGRLFYPGVSDRAKASVVSIEAGKFLKGINIQIPQTVEIIEISGQFLYDDEKPVAEAHVKFIPDDKQAFDEIRAETDQQGRFTIRIPKAAKGKLFGEEYYYGDHIKSCPKLDEIIKNTDSHTVKTQEINIDFESEIPQNVKLLFPFPECKKE